MVKNNWEILYQNKFNLKKKINVACILAYYNGSKYIKEQLQSIINQNQEFFNLTIFISDDNSDENFPNLNQFNIDKNKDLTIIYRKLANNIGYSKNFIYTLKSINSEFDYYCFSDQDDIWLENKIENAIHNILIKATLKEKFSSKIPILYGGRTTYYDENCKSELGNSLLFKKKPSFRNAIIQNIAGGNTMVFNNPAKKIIIKSINRSSEIISHDWWCYQIISGVNGIVYYDKLSFVKYRQHSKNLLGANNSIKDRFSRIKSLLIAKLKISNNVNLETLYKNKALLTKENQTVLNKLRECRNQSILKRILSFQSTGIYRQTFFGNLALFFAIVTKRI